MRNLSEYVNERRLEHLLTEEMAKNDSLLIEEGFFAKLKSLFKSAKEGVSKALYKEPESYRSFSTGQYLFAKSQDKVLMDFGKQMNDAAANADLSVYGETLTKVGQQMLDKIKNYDGKKLFVTQAYENVKNQLRLVGDSTTIKADVAKNAKELADKLEAAMKETFGEDSVAKATQENEKVQKQVEAAVKKDEATGEAVEGEEDENKDSEGEEIDGNAPVDKNDRENMGVSDDGKPEATTPDQQKEAIKNEIVENNDFFAPLAKEAKIDGNTLLSTVESFINKTWKYSKQDENGNAVLLWKKEIVGNFDKDIQDVVQNRAVKGIGSIICGLKIIGNDKMSEQVIAKLGDAKNTSGLMNLVKTK